MDFNELKKIVRLMETSSLNELELEEESYRLRIVKSAAIAAPVAAIPVAAAPPAPIPQPVQTVEATVVKATDAETESAVGNTVEVKSPIVGTFYRAPSPDADSFVKVGDTVQAGQVLCIVEAMKLMNEIESEVSGKIVKILVDNGKPVEYGQPLFLIEAE